MQAGPRVLLVARGPADENTQIPLPEAAGAPRILLPTTAIPLESLLSLERKESELQTDFLAASPSPLQPLLGKAERG